MECLTICLLEMINDVGCNTEQFFAALKNKHEEDEDAAFYLEMILAVTEFSQFVQMIQHYKRDHVKPKEEEQKEWFES